MQKVSQRKPRQITYSRTDTLACRQQTHTQTQTHTHTHTYMHTSHIASYRHTWSKVSRGGLTSFNTSTRPVPSWAVASNPVCDSSLSISIHRCNQCFGFVHSQSRRIPGPSSRSSAWNSASCGGSCWPHRHTTRKRTHVVNVRTWHTPP